jgi:hypothetical protein
MNPAALLTLTGTVTQVDRTGPRDIFGDRTEQTTTGPSTSGSGSGSGDDGTLTFKCWIWQTLRDENTVGGNVQAETYKIALEAAAETHIDGGDRITVRGVTYEFDGPPWPAFHPRLRRVTHVEADIRRVA